MAQINQLDKDAPVSSSDKTQVLNMARDILMNPTTRADYDLTLKGELGGSDGDGHPSEVQAPLSPGETVHMGKDALSEVGNVASREESPGKAPPSPILSRDDEMEVGDDPGESVKVPTVWVPTPSMATNSDLHEGKGSSGEESPGEVPPSTIVSRDDEVRDPPDEARTTTVPAPSECQDEVLGGLCYSLNPEGISEAARGKAKECHPEKNLQGSPQVSTSAATIGSDRVGHGSGQQGAKETQTEIRQEAVPAASNHDVEQSIEQAIEQRHWARLLEWFSQESLFVEYAKRANYVRETVLHVDVMHGCFPLVKRYLDMLTSHMRSYKATEFIQARDHKTGLTSLQMAEEIIGNRSITEYIKLVLRFLESPEK